MTISSYHKNILIVDDSYDKIQILATAIKEIPHTFFEVCHDSRTAIKMMREKFFDILIVDIQIPEFLGDPISKTGGKELIKRCWMDNRIKVPTHIIGVTSHEESFVAHRQYFEELGWPLIFKNFRHTFLKGLLKSLTTHTYFRFPKFDAAIITALRKNELDAVLNLPCNWRKFQIPGDPSFYYEGDINISEGKTKKILATSCSRMGVASSSATTMKVNSLFSPSVILMTGIAAGIKGKVKLGDIIVADPCWDWGNGKRTIANGKVTFQSAPHQLSLDVEDRIYFQEMSASRKHLDEISSQWQSQVDNSLDLHVGPLATGSVVLQDPKTVESIKDQHRETLGIEMEGYGFLYANSMNLNITSRSLVIKSVCDFADPDKNDDWQAYASYTSARVAYQYLMDRLARVDFE
jgi:nucleoside phosphorylase